MAKPKGSPKTGGIQKGTKRVRTLAWENLGEFITEAGAQKVKKLLDETQNPKEFFQYYGLLLEYFKPKLARTETQGEQEITIKFKRTIDGTEPGV